ncbi:hypothetical protein BH09BAC2_BH09BAC2_09520 [soil metagenome]
MKDTKDLRNDTGDLHDSETDKEQMKPERTTIDLPDVNDIPGQENIRPAPMGEMADITASSADEEGEGLWPEDNPDNDSDISPEERQLLDDAGTAIPDDENLRRAALDDTDEDGEPLNEGGNDFTGRNLDVPGTEADDADEDIGDEDEENNPYSLDDDNNADSRK